MKLSGRPLTAARKAKVLPGVPLARGSSLVDGAREIWQGLGEIQGGEWLAKGFEPKLPGWTGGDWLGNCLPYEDRSVLMLMLQDLDRGLSYYVP